MIVSSQQSALLNWARSKLACDGAAGELSMEPLAGDASYRRYFRLRCGDDAGRRYVLMVAEAPHEDIGQFCRAHAVFHDAGVRVPEMFFVDTQQGLAIIEDLGDETVHAALAEMREGDDEYTTLLYPALRALLRIQQYDTSSADIRRYDATLLRDECQLFIDWYCGHHRRLTLSDDERAILSRSIETLVEHMQSHKPVLVHRDYHSRNLMRCGEGQELAIIDFQDMVVGSCCYDIVSLCYDAYWDYGDEAVRHLLSYYWDCARASALSHYRRFDDFVDDCEWVALQRGLKVVGIFCRLWYRDGKAKYLSDLPLAYRHLRRICARRDDFADLSALLQRLAPEHAGGVD